MTDWDSKYFDKTYYSHLVQMRKPNGNIYEFVLRDAGLIAEESIFIDDKKENTDAAGALGIQTITHEIGAEVQTIMAHFL